ncbi:aryl-alcohol dehydrogenase [NADP+] [Lactarius akahatsu]|uniref:Aryl-alcohol dehydrogenase [NADP+] n=1 Tax=Lactarius akahatsu TaxID=416441 RepID=A0AAD4LIT3_9AGAM|nr:aryl-alcohol dehydrogenase [NADP+] [Lactarius akahatsu]
MSSKPLYAPPPAPVSKLARYRTLSPLAGVRVSPLCFGGLGIGDKWQYQDGASEEFIGEWAEKRGVWDQLVIATKYTGDYERGQENITHKVNYTDNHATSLHISVHESLRKLRTSYIDILYGISDAPAWVVSKANQYVRDLGKTPFVVYQGQWSVLVRSFERDIISMARSEGLALAPWGILGGGRIRTDAEEARRRESGEKGLMVFHSNWERTEEGRKMCLVLEEVAQEVAAIAYHLLRMPYVFPITGCRKVEHLRETLKALDITLTPERTQKIEGATTFEIGFPFKTFGTGATPSFGVTTTAHTDQVPLPQAIRPSKY